VRNPSISVRCVRGLTLGAGLRDSVRARPSVSAAAGRIVMGVGIT
jgi:hypothetical protein